MLGNWRESFTSSERTADPARLAAAVQAGEHWKGGDSRREGAKGGELFPRTTGRTRRRRKRYETHYSSSTRNRYRYG